MRIFPVILIAVLLGSTVRAGEPIAPRASVAVVQGLIEAAQPNARIDIPPGVYEGNLVIRKAVVLDGGGAAIFDAGGSGNVIEVLAEGVTIRRCIVRASGESVTGEPAGIRVVAAGATIEGNRVEDCLFGIDLREAPGAVIRGNRVIGKDLEPGRRGDGIRLWWSHECSVESNTISRSRDMVFWYSEELRIRGNTVTDSRYGLHFMYSHNTELIDNELSGNSVGVYLMYSNGITLTGNRMQNNRGASGYGIGLKDCDDIVIRGNALLANRVGAYIDNSPSSIDSTGLFESNLIAFNEIGLLATPNTHDNVFTGNAFIENEEPAATHGRGRLVKNSFARDAVGNYWSDYAGFDLDSDGRGDIAYEPRSLFSTMLAREPNLRIFVHSPAQRAIEFTARALPELRPEPVLIDPGPLVHPPAVGAGEPAGERSGMAMAIAAGGLGAIAATLALVLGWGPATARSTHGAAR